MSWVNKFDFTVDEGKGWLSPSRDKKLRQAPQSKVKKRRKKKSGVAFLQCDPGWYFHILTERCSRTSRINGITENKNNCDSLGRR